MLKAVLDANILVSAVLRPQGVPAQILRAWRQGQCHVVTCEQILAEAAEVLALPRIRRRYPLTDEHVARLLTTFRRQADFVSVATVQPVVKADADDDVILACALKGQVDCIATGDRHLLNLGVYEGIPVLSPRQFLDSLKAVTLGTGTHRPAG